MYAFTGFLDVRQDEIHSGDAGRRALQRRRAARCCSVCEEGEEEHDTLRLPLPACLSRGARSGGRRAERRAFWRVCRKKHHCRARRSSSSTACMQAADPFYQKTPEDLADRAGGHVCRRHERSRLQRRTCAPLDGGQAARRCELVVFNRMAPGTDVMPLPQARARGQPPRSASSMSTPTARRSPTMIEDPLRRSIINAPVVEIERRGLRAVRYRDITRGAGEVRGQDRQNSRVRLQSSVGKKRACVPAPVGLLS